MIFSVVSYSVNRRRRDFTSVMQVGHGKVDRWWDYFDLATLTNAAPQWWLDHIAAGYR